MPSTTAPLTVPVRQCAERASAAASRPSTATFASLPLFRDLPAEEFAFVHPQLRQNRIRAGASFMLEERQQVCFVLEGRFSLLMAAPPNRLVFLREHGCGDVFGCLSAVLGMPHGDRVRVSTDTGGHLLELPSDGFSSLLQSCPFFAQGVLRSIAATAAEQESRYFELSAFGVRDRIIAELLRLCRRGVFIGRRCVISKAPSQREIADRVGAAREVVSRALALLARDGLISTSRGALFVEDVTRLLDLNEARAGKRMFDLDRGGKPVES